MKAKKFIKYLGIAVIGAVILSACTNGSDDAETPDSENRNGERAVDMIQPEDFGRAFLAERYEEIYYQTSAEFQEQVTLDQLVSLAAAFNQDVTEYIKLSQVPFNDLTEYTWTDEHGEKGIRVIFGHDLTIAGLQIMPLSSYPATDKVFTQTEFILPTTTTWYVFWGGLNELVNYHYAVPSQRYAYDLLIMQDGKTYADDPTQNESYYAFGQEVIAPADGVIVAMANHFKDNQPQVETDPSNPLGNYVIIEHGHNEYSVLAHFKQDSIVVNVGDTVKQGDLLGLCGNSGNSTEPHIHFHVMDGADWQQANSIRIQFEGGLDPIRGDEVPAGRLSAN